MFAKSILLSLSPVIIETLSPVTDHFVDYTSVFEALPGNFIILKPDSPHFTILAISDEHLVNTGKTREEVIGKHIYEIFPVNPDAISATGPSAFRLSLEKVLSSKKADQMPVVRYDIPSANGGFEERYWSASSKPVLSAKGEILYIIHTTIDITSQVQTEKKQRTFGEIEKRYNQLLQAPVAISIVTGPENIIELANEQILTFWGRKEDVIGKPLFEALPEARTQGFAEILDGVRKTGEPFFAREYPARFIINGTETLRYYNIVALPYYEDSSNTTPAGVFNMSHDVTELVIARKQLEDSESRFRYMIQQAPIAITLTYGHDVVIASINAHMLQILGKTHDHEVLGKKMIEVLPEIENQKILAQVQRVFNTGKPFRGVEVPVELMVNGKMEIHYFDVSYTPLVEKEQITGVIHVAIDVTEKVQNRKKIEESENRFRSLIEESPIATCLFLDRDLIIEVANDSMIALWGKGTNIFGKSLREVLPELEGQPFLKILDNVFTTGITYEAQNTRAQLVKDGQLRDFYFDFTYKPLFDENGHVYGILTAAIDVTDQVLARRALEENQEELKRFKFMAEQARDPFILIREDGTFAYLNPKALEAWGYTKEEARHIRVPDVDPIYQDEIFSQAFAKAQKETIPQFETLHKRKDGHIYPVEVNMGGLLLGGEPHMFAIARNISERKQAEEVLEHKNAELLRINNDLDNFIYAASHDLKAPITNIEALLQALLRTLPPESLTSDRARQITAMMQESIERFKKTIANLTEVVKLQKEQNSEATPVSLADIVHEVKLDLETLIQASHARIVTELNQCTDIHFSEKNLRSVVYNLVSNGIKYASPDRTPVITITCNQFPEYHLLTITDNGLGMKPSHLEKLFTMFKRFHDHVEGSGIGLYMVKKMIDNAGGRIEVQSTFGSGSTFKVYFPR